MPKHINSASRLHSILARASGMADNATVLTVWSEAFQIEEPNDARKALRVSERLGWLHQELEILRNQMQGAEFSEELYASPLNRIEQSISTLLLQSNWASCKQYLSADTLLALAFCIEILPDEEGQINEADIDAIRSLVRELSEHLSSSTLPDSLKALIQHHIELIERAVAQYPIVGAKALREAARTALGEIIEAKDSIKENQGADEINKLGTVWKKINEVVDFAIKSDKIAQIGQKAWAFLEHLI